MVSKTYPVLALVTFFVAKIGTGYVSPGESVTSENTGYAVRLLLGAKMRSPNPFFDHQKEQNMSSNSILPRIKPGLSHFGTGISHFRWLWPPKSDAPRPNLHDLYVQPQLLPEKVAASPEAMRCLNLLGPLDLERLPRTRFAARLGTRNHAIFCFCSHLPAQNRPAAAFLFTPGRLSG